MSSKYEYLESMFQELNEQLRNNYDLSHDEKNLLRRITLEIEDLKEEEP